MIENINKLYEKSIYELGKLEKLPTNTEWNKIAKQKNLMSYTSIKTHSRDSFRNIYIKARRQFRENLYMITFKS